MRMAKPTFIALMALALFATPVLARNTKAKAADTAEDASPACSSYQLGADGNWEPLPCQELGPRSSPQQHRAPTKPQDDEAR